MPSVTGTTAPIVITAPTSSLNPNLMLFSEKAISPAWKTKILPGFTGKVIS